MVTDYNNDFFPRVERPAGCNEFVKQNCKISFVQYLYPLISNSKHI